MCFVFRRAPSGSQDAQKIRPAGKKNQITSTCDKESCSGNNSDLQDGPNHSFTERRDNQHNATYISMHTDDVISNPNAVAIALECNQLELNMNDLTHNTSDQIRVPASLTDSLFFYNQPVAILHAPAFFHVDEQPEQVQRSKSATLPRAGASNSAATEPLSNDNFSQTLPKGPSAVQNQATETEDQLGVLASKPTTTTTTPRVPFSLPESVSMPGTLNKMGGSRHSVHGLLGLTKTSPQPPRAWFVSLEGKPAAEIHYAVSEQQRRRRPVESRETSLDSGVDMSELNQTTGRRTVTLERNATFVKSKSSSKQSPPE